MKCPDAIPVKDGHILYNPPKAGTIPKERKKRNKSTTEKNADSKPKRKGRPKGSKNKKTLEREAALASQSPSPKSVRGRPKGSKNKKTLEREAAEAASGRRIKRKPGRPKGSKNKKTLEREALQAKQSPL